MQLKWCEHIKNVYITAAELHQTSFHDCPRKRLMNNERQRSGANRWTRVTEVQGRTGVKATGNTQFQGSLFSPPSPLPFSLLPSPNPVRRSEDRAAPQAGEFWILANASDQWWQQFWFPFYSSYHPCAECQPSLQSADCLNWYSNQRGFYHFGTSCLRDVSQFSVGQSACRRRLSDRRVVCDVARHLAVGSVMFWRRNLKPRVFDSDYYCNVQSSDSTVWDCTCDSPNCVTLPNTRHTRSRLHHQWNRGLNSRVRPGPDKLPKAGAHRQISRWSWMCHLVFGRNRRRVQWLRSLSRGWPQIGFVGVFLDPCDLGKYVKLWSECVRCCTHMKYT